MHSIGKFVVGVGVLAVGQKERVFLGTFLRAFCGIVKHVTAAISPGPLENR